MSQQEHKRRVGLCSSCGFALPNVLVQVHAIGDTSDRFPQTAALEACPMGHLVFTSGGGGGVDRAPKTGGGGFGKRAQLTGGALSAVHARCNYLGVWPY